MDTGVAALTRPRTFASATRHMAARCATNVVVRTTTIIQRARTAHERIRARVTARVMCTVRASVMKATWEDGAMNAPLAMFT